MSMQRIKGSRGQLEKVGRIRYGRKERGRDREGDGDHAVQTYFLKAEISFLKSEIIVVNLDNLLLNSHNLH